MKSEVITFAHYKGGTGKTTSCISIAGHLAKAGKRVLVVDLDPQGNLTTGFGINKYKIKYSMYDVMKGLAEMRHAILETNVKGIHLAPANLDLALAAITKYKRKSDAMILRQALNSVKKFYDYILVDTPPNQGHFIINGAIAADSIIIVLDPGVFALEGIETLNTLLEQYSKRLNININLAIAILNKCRQTSLFDFFRTNPTKQIEANITQTLKKAVFRIPLSFDIYESQIMGLPISHYKPRSKVSQAFSKVAEVILSNKINALEVEGFPEVPLEESSATTLEVIKNG
jgi:chromosome partitioning protein